MKRNSLSGLLVTLLILSLAVSLSVPSTPSASAQAEKTVFSRPLGYNPPPVGHWNMFVPGTISLADLVFEPLTHYFPANGTYLPGLATNWTYQDYSVFTLRLRSGVKWHDGREFNASDLWATWYSGVYINKDRSWQYLKNITIVDSHTLVFYMSQRNDYVPFYILWHYDVVPYSDYGPIAEKVYALIGQGYDINQNATPFADVANELKNLRPAVPIGTGPYKFSSISETEIVLEKNPNFWNGMPDIDEIRLVRVTAADVLWSMLADGQFDYHWALPTKEQHQLVANKSWVRVIGVPRPNGGAFYINTKVYPLSLVEVRKAIAYAINKTEIAFIQYPAGGTTTTYNVGFTDRELLAVLNQTFINTWISNYTYAYNPAKAEQILQGLGFTKGSDGVYVTPNGTRLEFEIKSGGWLSAESMDAISAELAQVGIKVTPRVMDAAAFTATTGDFYQGRYDLAAWVFNGADFMFDEMYRKYVFQFPGHGLPILQTVPWRPDPVNITDLTIYFQTYPALCTLQERNDIRSTLSYITASQVPIVTIASPTAYMYLNTKTFSGWPASNDPYWLGLGSYETHGSSYLFRWLILKPNLNVTISATPSAGGTVSPAPGTYAYGKGSRVTVTATPASGYTFAGWTLNGAPVSGATAMMTFTLNATSTLVATFQATQGLTISVSPSGGGTTSPPAGSYSYAQGQTVTVTATPASGYNFIGWKLDGTQVSTSTSYTVTMSTSHTLMATFERIPYELYAGGVVVVIAVIVVAYYMIRRRPPKAG